MERLPKNLRPDHHHNFESGIEVAREREPNLSLRHYIEKNSRILVEKDDLDDELKKISNPDKGSLSYSDSSNVKFTVEGYDFVFFDEDGSLRHTRIIPDEVFVLNKAGVMGERKDLEDKLKEAGFHIDDSEDLRSAIWQQLNTFNK